MLRRVLPWVACAASCLLSVPAAAQDVPDEPRVISYNTLGILEAPVVDVDTDATNRVWAVTPGAASAAVDGNRAPLFPISVADTPLAPTARFRSVSFAVPAGNAADGEFFYLGSSSGIAWGRVTSAIEFKVPLVVAPPTGTTFPPGDDPNNVGDTDSDGRDWLWAATTGGLVLWNLKDSDPAREDTYLDDSDDGPIQYVAVAPWGDAAAVDGDRLWLVDVAGNETLVRELSSGVFVGIAFDAAGNLWAATTLAVSGFPQVLKFEVNAASDGFIELPRSFPLNPFVDTGGGAPAGFAPTDIAVDPVAGRVWVTTESDNQGARPEAYFQDPVDAEGNLNELPGTNAWEERSSTFSDPRTVVHADTAGNAWLGMASGNGAINGYVVRLLTLDKSRYLGADTGVASLEDLDLFGGNGVPSEVTTITIAVGSESAPFTVTEQDDTGRFSQSFQIVPSDTPGVEGNVFRVGSSASDVPVEASYTFTGANDPPSDPPRELTATASWANIVSFEDDWWIGDFPCFLRSLGW